MVGLVVVSHSRALARAAADLAVEMVQDRPVPVEIAAGLDETTFGTDAIAITEAIAAADRGDGVVVLMDLGSAVLSAELALEMLDDDLRERVLLCPAPLVEGLVAAVVAAGGGAGRSEVAEEATAGLAGKQSQLGPPPVVSPEVAAPAAAEEGAFTVPNGHGLHARPAARLVSLARTFDARVELRNVDTGSAWVPASSLSRVATLGALRGHRVEVRAAGAQARRAIDDIVALAGRAFGEQPESSAGRAFGEQPESWTTTASDANPQAAAVGASPGIAIGPARQRRAVPLDVPDGPAGEPDAEWRRIEEAITAVRQELERLRERDTIFEAHLLLLDDPDLLGAVRSEIDAGRGAPQAWSAATRRVATEFDALEDPYLRGRAADVRAVAEQALRALLGASGTVDPGEGVLIAPDLTPAEAAGLDPERIVGVLLAFGSPTSHSAILLRTRGIPAVAGAGPAVLDIADGTTVGIDGGTGEVLIGTDVAALRERAAAEKHSRARAARNAATPAVSRDGVTVAVGANAGSLADAKAAAAGGADLIGLIRTEFLFLDRDSAPGVDEQEEALRAIAQALDGRRITVRTLDVGGDKPLRYLPAPREDNPFLGVRGLRYALRHPAMLRDQLLAAVRVARDAPVSLMFPMVSTVAELAEARRLLDDAIARSGGPTPAGLHVGIMVEVPSAALKAAAFAPYVDFFSIGTNDLTQYALAAERGNPELTGLADGLDPGVLRLVDAVCRGAGERVTVAVCGELAADPTAVPLLAGLGVRELSVVPPAVAAVKETVRATDVRAASVAAAAALGQPDAAAVRQGSRPS